MTKTTKEVSKVETDQTPTGLISMAVQRGASADELGKLMDLQERWEKKEARKLFYEAMTNFQYKLPEIKKGSKVSFKPRDGAEVSYAFASLPHIISQVKEPLMAVGLSYRWEQKDEVIDKSILITVTCILTHSAGHEERISMTASPDGSGSKNPIQQRASTVTYLRRYTLTGILGIGTAEGDNDTNDQSKPNQKKTPVPTPQQIEGIKKKIANDGLKLEDVKKHFTIDESLEKELLKLYDLDKPVATDEQFKDLCKKAVAGAITIEQASSEYDLSIDQFESLEAIFKAKK